MENTEKLIMEEAPLDDSTYYDAEPSPKGETDDPQGVEPFPFAMEIKEASINE